MEFDPVLLPPRRAESVARGYWRDRTINEGKPARLTPSAGTPRKTRGSSPGEARR